MNYLNIVQMMAALLALRRPPSEMRGKNPQIDSGKEQTAQSKIVNLISRSPNAASYNGDFALFRAAIRYLDSNIKPYANPCMNFQEYACGYFAINNLYDIVMGNKNTNISTHSERYANIDRILFAMLNRNERENRAIQRAKQMFNKCQDYVGINHEGDVTILKELKRVGFEEALSPHLLVKDDFINQFNYMAAWANLLKHPTLFSNFFMFRIKVIEDLEQKGKYVPLIQMSPGSDDPFVLQSEERTAITYVLDYYKAINTMPDVETEDQLSKINAEREALWSRLQQITIESNSIFGANNRYTRTNLTELQNNTNKWMAEMESSTQYPDLKYNKNFKIVWRNFFEELFVDVPNEGALGKNFQLLTGSKFTIYVSDMTKLQNIVKLLAKTQTKTFALSLWLTTVINTIPMGPEPLHKVYLQNAETIPKVLWMKREQLCLAIIKDTFRSVVAHELLQDVTTDDKIAVRKLLINTRKAFLDIINETEWLSTDAKLLISGRIRNLQIYFPYIETETNPELLDDMYKEMSKTNEMSAYESYTQILRIKRRTEFERIFVSKTKLPRLEYSPPVDLFSQDEVVKYYPLRNEIEMSLIIFGYPYYYGSNHFLQPLNVGSLGFHVVRQMVHVLDDIIDRIIQYKPTHLLKTEEESKLRKRIFSATMLTKRSESDKSKEDAKRMRMAQIEAVADNISLNVCYRTLLVNHSNSINKSLTGEDAGIIEKLTRNCKDVTPSQFFTTTLAMTMCKKSQLPSTTYVNYGERINELFQHWEDFQSVRKCANESDMMKIDKHESKTFIFSNADV